MWNEQGIFFSLSPEHQDDVIRWSLENRSRVHKSLQKNFEKIIEHCISIKGFRTPFKASYNQLCLEIKKVLKKNPAFELLPKAILDVWVESHPELRQVVIDFLRASQINLSELSGSPEDLPFRANLEDRVVEPLVLAHPQYQARDVRLMCEYLGRQSSEEAATGMDERNQEPTSGGVFSSLWLSFLEKMRQLPAEASEWEEIEAFLTQVREIASEKEGERQEAFRRRTLQEALQALKTDAANALLFFGFSDISRWESERVAASEVPGLVAMLQELAEKLLRHEDLRARQPATLPEMREHLAALQALQEEILALKARIDSRLNPETEPLEAQPLEAGPEAETEEDTEAPEAESVLDATEVTEEEQKAAQALSEAVEESQEEPAPPPALEGESFPPEEAEEPDSWEAYFWELIAQDDLAGAYWLCRSLEAQGLSAPVSSQVMAAVQGVRWLTDDKGELANDLGRLAIQVEKPGRGDAAVMLGLAAALKGCLILPSIAMFDWLQVPNCLMPEGGELVTAVQDFVQKGCRLFSLDLLEAGKAEERETAIKEVSRKVRGLVKEAHVARLKIRRASQTWKHLVCNDLADFLQPVLEDDRSQMAEVQAHLKNWQEQAFIEAQIDRIDRELTGLKRHPIVGEPRKRMIREVQELCQEAKRWCNLVELDRKVREQGNWLFNQAVNFRQRIQSALPAVEASLERLREPFALAAAASCLRRSLSQVNALFRLSPGNEEEHNHWAWLYQPDQPLEAVLRRRLLLLPEIPLDANYVPEESALPRVAQVLKEAGQVKDPLLRAYEIYLEKEDYHFLESDLLPALTRHPEYEALESRYEDARLLSLHRLSLEIRDTETAIEQALIDGIISDQERAEYDATIAALEPEKEFNFRPLHLQLEAILRNLKEARQNRLEDLQVKWRQMEKRLFTTSRISAEARDLAIAAVRRSIENQDTRVLEEHLAHLDQVLDGSQTLDSGWFAPPAPPRWRGIGEFLKVAGAIEDRLNMGHHQWQEMEACLRDGRSWAALRFGLVPPPRREEALAAIRAWLALKQGTSGSGKNLENLQTLFQYLGFSLDTGRRSAVVIEEKITQGLRGKGYMSASSVLARPFPQFGSLAGNHYDVICLWDRPDADTVANKLLEKRLGQQPVLLLYLGRLSDRRRLQLVRQEFPAVAVLDETLLVFLAQESDNRLPTFLRCALPFSTLIPYTPFQAGDVPPEMFYGRQEMVQELLQPSGSCLVYGGRQLGKSALLRHVAREFHHPERGQFARVKDIKLVGDPKADLPPRAIWRILRDALQEMGLFSERLTTENPEDIEKKLRNLLADNPTYKIMVLFDEADNFFEADVKDKFREVEKFRILMTETGRRFRVVFTGLNNVLRFQGLPNQPFAHLGSPLCVGALEPYAARQLVKEPLEALGYYFEDDSLILKILSYTNYHPGLIQLFCRTLLQNLHQRVVTWSILPSETNVFLPPYSISREKVESVYLNDTVRKEIKARLEWTLELDERYQAIAWTMIVDQMRARDSYARSYSASQILNLVRDWWPKGFSHNTSEQIRTFLEEMCALNVLVRNSSGEYRLRSPNLVRLLGTESEIENRLENLMGKNPSEPFDETGHHAPLDEAAQRYSPFLYFQSARLKQEKFGVGLIFSSEALGLELIPQAVCRFIPRDFPSDLADCSEIPATITHGTLLSPWVHNYLEKHVHKERLILYRILSGSSEEDLASLISAAISFCRSHQKSRKRWLRIFFIFSPQAAWRWLSSAEYERWENAADALVITQRWNAVGVRQRLEQTGKQDTEEIVRQVLEVTGGWPLLVDELFDRCGERDNPIPESTKLTAELMDPENPLHCRFKASLGICEGSFPFRVLQHLLREKEVERELFIPELLEPEISRQQWDRALEHLSRMGCLGETDGILRIDPIVLKVLEA